MRRHQNQENPQPTDKKIGEFRMDMDYDELDCLENLHCDDERPDYRKNLRCCRDMFDLIARVTKIETRVNALENKKAP